MNKDYPSYLELQAQRREQAAAAQAAEQAEAESNQAFNALVEAHGGTVEEKAAYAADLMAHIEQAAANVPIHPVVSRGQNWAPDARISVSSGYDALENMATDSERLAYIRDHMSEFR